MSRSVTMPWSFLPSSTTTEEMPCVRIFLATSANESLGLAVFTSGVHDLADEHRPSSRCGAPAYYGGLRGHRRWHDAVMAKPTYVANVTVFDGEP